MVTWDDTASQKQRAIPISNPAPAHHNTTLLLHRAPQLIANPVPNLLLADSIRQLHVQLTQRVATLQAGDGAAKTVVVEIPDMIARGSRTSGSVV